MGKIISFHYYKSFIYIEILILSKILFDNFLESKFKKIYSETSLELLITNIGKSLAYFLFLIEKKYLTYKKKFINQRTFMMEKIEETKNENPKKHSYILFIIFFLTLLDFTNYNLYVSNILDAQNIKIAINGLGLISYGIFLIINEHYYLNIEIYKHHCLGLILCFISIFLYFFYILFVLYQKHFVFHIILFLIISCELGFLFSIQSIIEKKLNFDYYVSIYYICFIEGIFGLFLIGIYFIILTFLFNDNTIFIFFNNINNIIQFIIITILYSIINLIFYICRLKIFENNRPSYYIIASLLSQLIKNIFNSKYIIFTMYFISLLGCLIFCEIITLDFCGLDKYTFEKTSDRGFQESLLLKKSTSYDKFED